MKVINPIGVPITYWCDVTAQELAPNVPPMKIDREEDWRRWGAHVLQLLRTKATVIVPDPYQFPDFISWATRFNQVIQEI